MNLKQIFTDFENWIIDRYSSATITPMNEPQQTVPTPQVENPDLLLPWEFNVVGSENNRHNVRVLCDLGGLTWDQKEVLTACVRVESDFDTGATHHNTNNTEDIGICQFNTGVNEQGTPFWIGPGAAFPNIEYVLQNPEACVKEMVAYYKETGNLNPWVSYTSKAYLEYLGKV